MQLLVNYYSEYSKNNIADAILIADNKNIDVKFAESYTQNDNNRWHLFIKLTDSELHAYYYKTINATLQKLQDVSADIDSDAITDSTTMSQYLDKLGVNISIFDVNLKNYVKNYSDKSRYTKKKGCKYMTESEIIQLIYEYDRDQ